jgi:hypothetical protein
VINARDLANVLVHVSAARLNATLSELTKNPNCFVRLISVFEVIDPFFSVSVPAANMRDRGYRVSVKKQTCKRRRKAKSIVT